jgi:hypothetical protein
VVGEQTLFWACSLFCFDLKSRMAWVTGFLKGRACHRAGKLPFIGMPEWGSRFCLLNRKNPPPGFSLAAGAVFEQFIQKI